jgi:general stress protein 26
MKKIAELEKSVRVAMMAIIDANGQIHRRPMAIQDEPFD